MEHHAARGSRAHRLLLRLRRQPRLVYEAQFGEERFGEERVSRGYDSDGSSASFSSSSSSFYRYGGVEGSLQELEHHVSYLFNVAVENEFPLRGRDVLAWKDKHFPDTPACESWAVVYNYASENEATTAGGEPVTYFVLRDEPDVIDYEKLARLRYEEQRAREAPQVVLVPKKQLGGWVVNETRGRKRALKKATPAVTNKRRGAVAGAAAVSCETKRNAGRPPGSKNKKTSVAKPLPVEEDKERSQRRWTAVDKAWALTRIDAYGGNLASALADCLRAKPATYGARDGGVCASMPLLRAWVKARERAREQDGAEAEELDGLGGAREGAGRPKTLPAEVHAQIAAALLAVIETRATRWSARLLTYVALGVLKAVGGEHYIRAGRRRFSLSRRFIQRLCREEGWRCSKPKGYSNKLPEHAAQLVRDFRDRVAYMVYTYDVRPALSVNADQSGLHFVQQKGGTCVPGQDRARGAGDRVVSTREDRPVHARRVLRARACEREAGL